VAPLVQGEGVVGIAEAGRRVVPSVGVTAEAVEHQQRPPLATPVEVVELKPPQLYELRRRDSSSHGFVLPVD
jgi:hypothetical protein